MAKITRSPGVERAFDDVFPIPVKATRAPTSSDIKYPLGQLWVRTDTAQVYILAQLASGAASWTLASPGASDVDTLTGDAGGAISPAAGNITLAGGTNIGTTGAGSTITFNLDNAITLATSVTSPLYTVGAATDMAITSAAGQDIIIKMGDAAGVNKVSFIDSADVEVAAIDSNGGFSMGAITFTGLLTANASATINTAGTALNLATDNSADAVNIGLGTAARAIHIGDSGAAHTITIGSTTGGASLTLQYGTGNFSVTGSATGTITIGGATETGTMTLASSTTTMTLNIANANGAKTINLGNGVDGNTISIGNGINTSAQTINIAGGAAAADSTVNILSGNATAGTQTLNLGTGNRAKAINIGNGIDGNTITIGNGINTTAQTISIGNGASAANSTVSILSGVGTAGAGTLSMANNTRVTTIDLGNIAPAAARITTLAGGNSAQDDTVNILNGAPSAGTQTVSILSGNASGGTQTLNLGNGNRATAINIGNGTGGNTILIGNGVNSAAQTISIGNGAAGANQTVNILSGNAAAGTQTLNLAQGTGGKTVNIATSAGVNSVTIGSTNSTSSLTLQSGTGNITVTGTVNEIDAKFLARTGDDITFQQSPTTCTAANTGGVATGATGDLNLLMFQEGIIMEQFILGLGQTIIKPVMTSSGLLVSGDLTVAEGFEYNFGAARTNSRHAFTIGTSAAFFFEMRFTVADVSGASPYMIGFRKTEANNATLTSYTDYAMIGLDAIAAVGTVVLKTELNSGGTTNTNTTDAWTDGQTHTVRINVDGSGNVTYLIDGLAPTVTAAFQFDNADVVVPFLRIEHAAVAPGTVNLNTMKIGFQ